MQNGMIVAEAVVGIIQYRGRCGGWIGVVLCSVIRVCLAKGIDI